MTRFFRNIAFIFPFLLIALVSCRKTAPQLPANKQDASDSVEVSMLKINQKLILHEDSMLADYISRSDSDFIKNNLGFWYKINTKTDGASMKEKSKCFVFYRVYSLENNLLLEKNDTIQIGKKQIINGIEEGVKLMKKGESATLILPWYEAYGMKGYEDKVKAYTSVKVYLRVLN